MATERVRGRRRVGSRRNPPTTPTPTPLLEDIVPNSSWTQDPSGSAHCLLVNLPEFKKNEVKLQVDGSSGRIIVKGERQANEHKRVRFQLTFLVPTDSDIDNISGNFDSQILYVYVPKRDTVIQKPSHSKQLESDLVNENIHEDNIQNENAERFFEELITRTVEQESRTATGVELLRRNKGIAITALVAFSFGLYVSHKFHS